MSHSHPCNLTWPPANHRCFAGSLRRQQMLQQDLGHTGEATDHRTSFGFQNKPVVLDESRHNTFQQWEHLSALPFPRAKRKDLSHTDEHSSLFTSAWHWTCTAWAHVNNVHNEETMVACMSHYTGKHHVGKHVIQGRQPAPENVIASSPGDMNLSLLNNANSYPDAGNPSQCENNKKYWDCMSSSVLFGMKHIWRDLYLGSMTVTGINRQVAWDPANRHGLKNKTRIIHTAHISHSCDLAFRTEVELMVKDSRQKSRSPVDALSTWYAPISLPVCKWHRNHAGAVVTGTRHCSISKEIQQQYH